MTRDSVPGRPWILAFDTGTSRVVVAAGTPAGDVIAEQSFPAEHRHGELLLAAIDQLAAGAGLALDGLRGVVAGTGPGAFTGLRVGLATAKTLAHELGIPIAGVSTATALAAAAGGGVDVWLPAGPQDRVEVRPGAAPRLVAARATEPTASGPVATAERDMIAVDLEGRADDGALARGRAALDGLAAALLRLGSARLTDGGDDPETLVPEYVTLPRGVTGGLDLEGGVTWSLDHR
ncbi:MAG TPA: tRNA (adenosine(37)-N6)-threonylcarbamoyltransferase complex dimerization subunit type 1 TsaB [Candidatus Limnocylindrales bacterium]|nr:tRNA (adenosine(37)-N6)-threonylcarbamoyltransferase complex dimerization subunit type 1 TsaB [Candidatus Limnocylindrales bacterium]